MAWRGPDRASPLDRSASAGRSERPGGLRRGRGGVQDRSRQPRRRDRCNAHQRAALQVVLAGDEDPRPHGLDVQGGRCSCAGSSHVRPRCHRPRCRPGGRGVPGCPACPSGPSRRTVLARSRRCERCLSASWVHRHSSVGLRRDCPSSTYRRRFLIQGQKGGSVSWSAAISQLDSRLRGSWSALDDADSPSSDLECVLERDASPITRTKRRGGAAASSLTSSWYAKRRPAPEGRPPHSVPVRPGSIRVGLDRGAESPAHVRVGALTVPELPVPVAPTCAEARPVGVGRRVRSTESEVSPEPVDCTV